MKIINQNIKKIKKDLFLVIMVIIVFNIIGTILLYNISSSQNSDAVIINLSGAQRMLSQRMTKEVLKINIYKDKSQEYKKQLQVFCKRFDLVLNGLKFGNKKLGLPIAKDIIIIEKLNLVFKLWKPFKKSIKNIINSTNEDIDKDIDIIIQLNNKLLSKMNDTVYTFEVLANNKIKNTIIIKFTISFFITIIAIIAWFLLIAPLLKTINNLIDDQQKRIITQEKTESDLHSTKVKIEEKNRELQSLIDGVPFPIMVIDMDYNISVSNTAVRKINNNLDPIKNKLKCYEVSHKRKTPCDGDDDPCPLIEALNTKKSITTVHNHFNENGIKNIVEVKATPLFDDKGNVEKIIETSYDITDRVNLQISLSKSKENAISANKAKSEFLANMSHEIRTPLNAILGFSDILLNKETESEKKDQLKIVVNSSINLKNLINDILDFSKIEAGKLEIENSTIPIKNIIDQTVSMFFLKAKENNIKLIITTDKLIPQFIISDEQKIKQVLTNLIGNALKFTKKGTITISSELKGEHIAISIKDTGIGIHKDKLNDIFFAFEQADTSTTRKFGGTGLGLAISKSLANLLGGDISVSSLYAKGSTFTFTFKYKKIDSVSLNAYRVDKQKPITSMTTFEGYSILVAEDDINNQKLIKSILKDLKANYTIAENGAIAIEILKKKNNSFDLMLLDMQMPVKDGIETIKEIREKLRMFNLPVIAFTANATSESIKKFKDAGCTDFLSKPTTKQKIQDMLSKHLIKDTNYEYLLKDSIIDKIELSDIDKIRLISIKEKLEKNLDIFDPALLKDIAKSFMKEDNSDIIKNMINQIILYADDFDEDGIENTINYINELVNII